MIAPYDSIWLELEIERDPFNLNAGETVDVKARIKIISARRVGAITSLLIQERDVNGKL